MAEENALQVYGHTVICKVYKRGWLPESEWRFVENIITDAPETWTVTDVINHFQDCLQASRLTYGVIQGYEWELRITYPMP